MSAKSKLTEAEKRARRRERLRLVTRWRVLFDRLHQLDVDISAATARGVFTQAEEVEASRNIAMATDCLLDPPTIIPPRGAE